MGYEQKRLAYAASVSRHNSSKDHEHDVLWADFCRRVEEIAADSKYQPILLMESS